MIAWLSLCHSRVELQGTTEGSLSLQVFCGMLARVSQFADVMRDSREQLRQVPFLLTKSHLQCLFALGFELNNESCTSWRCCSLGHTSDCLHDAVLRTTVHCHG